MSGDHVDQDGAGLDCAATRELMPGLAAGVAPEEDRAAAARHLAGCPDCRRELESIAYVVDELLPLAPDREPPPGFEARVLARLDPTPRPSQEPQERREARP